MRDESLTWLMQWYLAECNGDWEHSYGLKIETLDNPGWTLSVDLRETDLQERAFTRIEHGEIADDLGEWRQTGSWYIADVKDGIFDGSCGPLDLPALIQVFRQWIESS
jgi:hypothetical protein